MSGESWPLEQNRSAFSKEIKHKVKICLYWYLVSFSSVLTGCNTKSLRSDLALFSKYKSNIWKASELASEATHTNPLPQAGLKSENIRKQMSVWLSSWQRKKGKCKLNENKMFFGLSDKRAFCFSFSCFTLLFAKLKATFFCCLATKFFSGWTKIYFIPHTLNFFSLQLESHYFMWDTAVSSLLMKKLSLIVSSGVSKGFHTINEDNVLHFSRPRLG